jgi:perosamine synthetase
MAMTAPDPTAFVARLRQALGGGASAQLHEPYFGGREWEYVKECLDTGWISSVGSRVGHFEELLSQHVDGRRAVACVNGTAALRVALELAGVGRDDEVLIPALTFVATANSVSHLGAISHFVDSSEATLGLHPARLSAHLDDIAQCRDGRVVNRKSGRRLAAIVPMHCFGHPVDMDPLLEVAARWQIPVVEDATESLGSRYKGRMCGALAPLAALSFNGNKIVTTGGGGAIVAADVHVARRAKHITTTAKLPHRWAFVHDEVGYNDRMPNINAAVGVAQLEQLPRFLAAKRALQKQYEAVFDGFPGATLFRPQPWAESNIWLAVLLLDRPDAAVRDAFLEASNAVGLMTRPAWTLMHRLAMYRDNPRAPLAIAEALEARIICLPSSAALGFSHV